jgi:hypothetical protein
MKDGPEMMFEAGKSLTDLLNLGTKLGLDLLDTFSRSSSDLMGTVSGMLGSSSRSTTRHRRGCNCGCHIPPACWEPLCAGEVHCHACPGSTAILRIRIENCAAHHHRYAVEGPSGVTITPAVFDLAPLERATVTVSVPVDPAATSGQSHEYLIWIRGCRDHYVRFTVTAATRGSACCCYEIEVEDCGDTIHHWYDHFYCAHPCQHRAGV